jgi:hypothetical protein
MNSTFKVYRDIPSRLEIFKDGWIANVAFLSFLFPNLEKQIKSLKT